jgi:hypothetical protein
MKDREESLTGVLLVETGNELSKTTSRHNELRQKYPHGHHM